MSDAILELSDTEKTIQQMLHFFAETEMRPIAAKHDEEETMPWELMEKASMYGLSQIAMIDGGGDAVPKEVKDAVDDSPKEKKVGFKNRIGVVGAEELAWGCAGISLALSGSGLAAAPVSQMGTPEQKQLFKDLMKGKDEKGRIKIAAMALSEPSTGSDISGLATTARKDGDYYVLNGSKQWITNGQSASVYVVWAQTNKELGRGGVRGFIVPRDTPGQIPGKKETKLGIRASETAQVHYEECRVHKDLMLGGEEIAKKGLKGTKAMLDSTRPMVGAQAVGIARAAYEYILDYVKKTEYKGQPLCQYQNVAFALADMAMQIEAARLLVRKSAWMADMGIENVQYASMGKALGAKTAEFVTSTCVAILGDEGWTRKHPVEKYYRDQKIYDIFEGTGQVQRRIIAKHLTGINPE
jgi:acyl-CoA dehydrogenase